MRHSRRRSREANLPCSRCLARPLAEHHSTGEPPAGRARPDPRLPSPARAPNSWSCRRRARRSECPRSWSAAPSCRPGTRAPPSWLATPPERCPDHRKLEPARTILPAADSRENGLQHFVLRAPGQLGEPSVAPASKSFGPPPTCGCGPQEPPVPPERHPGPEGRVDTTISTAPPGDDRQRQGRFRRTATPNGDVGYPPGCRTQRSPALKEAGHDQSPGNQSKNEERAPHHAGTDPEPRLTDSRRPLSTLLRPFSDAAKGGLVPPNAKLVTDATSAARSVPQAGGGHPRSAGRRRIRCGDFGFSTPSVARNRAKT